MYPRMDDCCLPNEDLFAKGRIESKSFLCFLFVDKEDKIGKFFKFGMENMLEWYKEMRSGGYVF